MIIYSFSIFLSFSLLVSCCCRVLLFVSNLRNTLTHTHTHSSHLPFAKNAMAKILKQYFKICLAFSRSSELVFCPCSLPENPPPTALACPALSHNTPLFIRCLPANFICLHVRLHVVFLFHSFFSFSRSSLTF